MEERATKSSGEQLRDVVSGYVELPNDTLDFKELPPTEQQQWEQDAAEMAKDKPYEVIVKGRDLVLGYACPKCKIFHGATIYACKWEDAVVASREAAERCCNQKCEDCGIALKKEYRVACIPCQRVREVARELAAFDKAEKIPESKYDGWLSYRSEYYRDTDALHDHCEQNGLEWPAWVWSCSQTELSLDADSVLESALENHYEDARDSIGQSEEDKLQALLNEWCANQKIVSWEEDQSRAVILEPRELNREDDSEDV